MGSFKVNQAVTLASVLLFALCSNTVSGQGGRAPSKAPAFFVFGDSLVDNGNNNYIASLARANYYPNGIDFPGRQATGRFCNGKTVLDFVADAVGVPYAPPYLQPSTRRGQNILRGVNYASGAGGILDATGANYIDRIGFNGQLRSFSNTIGQLNQILGPAQATSLLNTALYGLVFGSNDYINNYLQPNAQSARLNSPLQYQQILIDEYGRQLTDLYNFGARKIVVTNVGPLGCIPSQISMVSSNVNGDCIPSINNLVVGFNRALRQLLLDLNARLAGAKFTYANVYDQVLSLSQNPRAAGFAVGNAGCCGGGRFGGQLPCLPTAQLCAPRNSFVFWDPFHPTEAANRLLADSALYGGPNQISPVNIFQLIDL